MTGRHLILRANGKEVAMIAVEEPEDLLLGETVRRFGFAGDPDSPAFIPEIEGEFQIAPDLQGIADTLIRSDERLAPLQGCEMRWYWRNKASKSGGQTALGRVQIAQGLVAYETGANVVLWLSAESCREIAITNRQLEAAVYHELCKVRHEEKGDRWIIRRPDFAGFLWEVERFGAWWSGLADAREALRQAPLFE